MFSIIQQFILVALLHQSLTGCSTFDIDRLSGDVTGSCDELLQNFAASSANFTYCAIINARPITFCENCIKNYLSVLESYQAIFETIDESGQPCKIKLLNLDRVQTIDVIFKSTSELWTRGQCDYCFETTSNGTLTSELRNTTKEFKRRCEIVGQCIAEHRNDTSPKTVCVQCKNTYHLLNEYYNHIKMVAAEKDSDNVCMDIVDLMNTTRVEWSNELHCVPSRRTQVPLYVSGGLLVLTPFMFYAFSMWFSKRDRVGT